MVPSLGSTRIPIALYFDRAIGAVRVALLINRNDQLRSFSESLRASLAGQQHRSPPQVYILNYAVLPVPNHSRPEMDDGRFSEQHKN